MRKKASSWYALGGGGVILPLGHFGPGVIRGRLGSISPFAFIAFMQFCSGYLAGVRLPFVVLCCVVSCGGLLVLCRVVSCCVVLCCVVW